MNCSDCFVFASGSLFRCTDFSSQLNYLLGYLFGVSAEQVLMISVALLVILFSMQKFGTSKLGLVVGPALFIWFCSLAGVGIYNLIKYDRRVWRAFNPIYIYYFFKRNSVKAWYALGGCLLCATGKRIFEARVCKPNCFQLISQCTPVQFKDLRLR